MSNQSIARVPHVHAEVIKAWASGEQIQMRTSPAEKWRDMTLTHPHWDVAEYRIKPEKVYPATQMGHFELARAFMPRIDGVWSSEAAKNIANAALRHAIDAGQIITMADHQDALLTLADNLRGVEIARHAARDMAIAVAVRDAVRGECQDAFGCVGDPNLQAVIDGARP
jgi:hypothetical protein